MNEWIACLLACLPADSLLLARPCIKSPHFLVASHQVKCGSPEGIFVIRSLSPLPACLCIFLSIESSRSVVLDFLWIALASNRPIFSLPHMMCTSWRRLFVVQLFLALSLFRSHRFFLSFFLFPSHFVCAFVYPCRIESFCCVRYEEHHWSLWRNSEEMLGLWLWALRISFCLWTIHGENNELAEKRGGGWARRWDEDVYLRMTMIRRRNCQEIAI